MERLIFRLGKLWLVANGHAGILLPLEIRFPGVLRIGIVRERKPLRMQPEPARRDVPGPKEASRRVSTRHGRVRAPRQNAKGSGRIWKWTTLPGPFASLAVEGRASAPGGPDALAFPAGLRIVDAAVHPFGEEAERIGNAHDDPLAVHQREQRIGCSCRWRWACSCRARACRTDPPSRSNASRRCRNPSRF